MADESVRIDPTNNTIHFSDPASGRTQSVVLSNGIGAAEVRTSSDGRSAFVINARRDTIFVLDTATRTVRSRIDDLGSLLHRLWDDPYAPEWFVVPESPTSPKAVLFPRYASLPALVDVGCGRFFGKFSLNDGNYQRTVGWFDLGPPRSSGLIPVGDYVRSLVHVPEMQALLVVHESALTLLDTQELRPLSRVPLRGTVNQVAVAPNARLAFVSHVGEEYVSVVDLDRGHFIDHVRIPARSLGISAHPDGEQLHVSTREEGIVNVEVATYERRAYSAPDAHSELRCEHSAVNAGSLLAGFRDHPIEFARHSPDGRLFLFPPSDGALGFVDPDLGISYVDEPLPAIPRIAGVTPVDVGFSSDGEMIFVAYAQEPIATLRYDADGELLWGGGMVIAFDAHDLQERGRLAWNAHGWDIGEFGDRIGAPTILQMNGDGSRAFVATNEGGVLGIDLVQGSALFYRYVSYGDSFITDIVLVDDDRFVVVEIFDLSWLRYGKSYIVIDSANGRQLPPSDAEEFLAHLPNARTPRIYPTWPEPLPPPDTLPTLVPVPRLPAAADNPLPPTPAWHPYDVWVGIDDVTTRPGAQAELDITFHAWPFADGLRLEIDLPAGVRPILWVDGLPDCELAAALREDALQYTSWLRPIGCTAGVDCTGVGVDVVLKRRIILNGPERVIRCRVDIDEGLPEGSRPVQIVAATRSRRDGNGGRLESDDVYRIHGEIRIGSDQASPLLLPRAADAPVSVLPMPASLRIDPPSVRAAAGAEFEFAVRADGNGIVGLQMDLTVDSPLRIVQCRRNSESGKHAFLTVGEPNPPTHAGRSCPDGTTCRRVRAIVVSFEDREPLRSGEVLFTCRGTSDETAGTGTHSIRLGNVMIAGDTDANGVPSLDFAVTTEHGAVEVVPAPEHGHVGLRDRADSVGAGAAGCHVSTATPTPWGLIVLLLALVPFATLRWRRSAAERTRAALQGAPINRSGSLRV